MKNLYVLSLITISFLFGCIQKYENVDTFELENGNPNFAVPLINTTISIQDVLDNVDTQEYLEVNGDGSLTLVYSESLGKLKAEEFVEVEDFSVLILDTLNLLPIDDNFMPLDLDYLNLKSGALKLSYDSNHDEDLDIVFQINNISKDGSFFNYEKNIIVTGSGTFEVNETIDLGGHLIDFQSNYFIVRYSSKNAANQHRPLQNISLEFIDLEYDFLQGYLEQQYFELFIDTTVVEIFEKTFSGTIEVEDPNLRLIAENSIGVPIIIVANDIEAVSESQGTLNLESDLQQGVSIASPDLSEIGNKKITTFLFDNTNSNISDFINSNPYEMRYLISAMINPEADQNIRGFLTDESELNLRMEIETSAWLKINDLTIIDTVDFELEAINEIIEAEFKLITESSLPTDASIQLFFLDDQGTTLDSLFNLQEELVQAGTLDTNGKVIASTKKEHDPIIFDEEKLGNIYGATKVIIKGKLSGVTETNVGVQFFADNTLTVQLGVKALIDIDGE